MEDYVEKPSLSLDYLTKNSGKRMSSSDKCDLVLNRVRSGKIIVIEGGLNCSEEALLIQKSMSEIDHEKFLGVEIFTNGTHSNEKGIFRKTEKKVTVIAPASTELAVRTF